MAARPSTFALLALLAACGDPSGGPDLDVAPDGGSPSDTQTPDTADATAVADADSANVADAELPLLSPAGWPEGELALYTALDQTLSTQPRAATGARQVIAGTTSALAIRAGYEALERGGTAADAVLAAANAQVVLAGGSYVSYAGIFFMTYYEADSGQVFHLNAGYDIPAGELDPLSIPAQGSGTPSGRTALVPGYFAGVAAAHDRFGALPFGSLFDAAVYFADEGFEVDAVLGALIASRADVLTRLPATRAVFTKLDGGLYRVGDHLRQPALAETLRQVQAQGVDYVYTGAWAHHFVTAVGDEGGVITLADLAAYEPLWTTPLRTTFGGYTLVAPGLPSFGGVDVVEAFNLIEAAGLTDRGHYTASAESFFWLAQILRASILSYLPPDTLAALLPGTDLSLASRADKATAGALWAAMEAGELYFTRAPTGLGTHSDALVAVDAAGNVAAVVHSINTTMWGETGIFVDGVSIPDSACFQQDRIARAGPGQRLPDPTNPVVVLKDGAPVYASASINGGLHARTVSMMWTALGFGANPAEAQAHAALGLPDYAAGLAGDAVRERVRAGDFPAALLDDARALGLTVDEVGPSPFASLCGFWVGASIDPDGTRYAVAAEDLDGVAIGD